MRLMSRI